MGEIKKNDAITSQTVDFAKWYTDVCKKAELMDYSDLKGFIIYRPYGYAIWEQIQAYLDKEFKKVGTQNVYMPLLIPESLFTKEKEHVQGFAPECAIVTRGGNKDLEEPLYIRPTSETLFCQHWQKVLSSYRDLPMIYNQWCSVVRWEKTTRPFLRGSEFLWQEGHTLHSSEAEARELTLKMLDVYNSLGHNLLAMPFMMGQKTEKEKFAGAINTYTIEALMPDGQALQSGTTHYFGQGFAEKFGIRYQDETNKLAVPHQTSWGVSTRLIGALIMEHGDDNGLVLPPFVAPIQVVIIPIMSQKEGVLEACEKIKSELLSLDIRVKLDNSNRTPGWKFSEYEMKGVPVRIEIGPRDLANGEVVLAKRYNGSKETIKVDDVASKMMETLNDINEAMYQKSNDYLNSHIIECQTMEEIEDCLTHNRGYAKVMWDGELESEMKIKELFGASSRCLPFDQTPFNDICPMSGKKATSVVLFARSY